MTVNEEADSVPYGETQDAAEITETVEESSETVTQVTVTESTETEKAETAAALYALQSDFWCNEFDFCIQRS